MPITRSCNARRRPLSLKGIATSQVTAKGCSETRLIDENATGENISATAVPSLSNPRHAVVYCGFISNKPFFKFLKKEIEQAAY